MQIGGMALHEGKVAEMRTGEGKTLSAVLPAYLNALSGRGVHLITVNEYLAVRDCEWCGADTAQRRLGTWGFAETRKGPCHVRDALPHAACEPSRSCAGAEAAHKPHVACRLPSVACASWLCLSCWHCHQGQLEPSSDVPRHRRMGKVFEFLGMTVAVVRADDNAAQLRAAFSADAVYITAQQLAFTYLGDNTLKDESSIVRPLLSHHGRRRTGQLTLLPACHFACIARSMQPLCAS